MTCVRTQEFLGRKKVDLGTVVNAKKTRLGETDALELVSRVDEIYAAKGRKVVHLDLRKDKPGKAEILNAIMGPSGNLRAPAIQRGRTLFVGFNEEAFASLLA